MHSKGEEVGAGPALGSILPRGLQAEEGAEGRLPSEGAAEGQGVSGT